MVYKKIYVILILISTFFMSLGYASINDISLEVNSLVSATPQNGIFITDVEYVSSQYANVSNSKVISIYQNNLNSSINLGSNPNAYITYKVTLYNSTSIDYVFERVKYQKCSSSQECLSYSNNNIGYSVNIANGELLSSKNSLSINITFSYIDVKNINNTSLNSILNFYFTEANKTYLLNGQQLNRKIKNQTTDVNDYTVNKVVFGKYEDYSNVIQWNSYESFVDEEENGSIRLFRIVDSNTTSVYILSNNTIYANPNSGRSFQNLRSMSEIKFDNYDTSQVTDMTRMFYMFSESTLDHHASLKSLDLSNWDVYNVTTLRATFGYNTLLEHLDVSTWETENCTNMGYLFQELRSLKNLDLSNFDTSNVVTTQGMFLGFTGAETLDISSFDTSKVTIMTNMFDASSIYSGDYELNLETIYVSDQFTIDNVTDKTMQMFEGNSKLVGGNGSKYDATKINVNYAVIDKAIYDANGNYISGEIGYFTKK